jgi:holo-[acyl-carrier protein] synthase
MGNSLLGLGTDIIEIERIRRSLERHGDDFLNRIFTKKEQEYCRQYKDPTPHFAGRFSAKEAIAKALGTGLGASLGWCDLEILPDEKGRPVVHLSKEAEARFSKPKILVSISHCTTHAMATAALCTS